MNIDISKINCDHLGQMIIFNGNHQPTCANCRAVLSENQMYMMALKGRELCMNMLRQQKGEKVNGT